MAKEPRRWTQAEVERVLAVSEDWERELEEERDVVKALQVRLVLEDAARLGSEGRATMRDELERYSEYRKYADAGVRAAWQTLKEAIADIDHPPHTAPEEMRRELERMTVRVVNLQCDSTDVHRLLRRSSGVPSLGRERDELEQLESWMFGHGHTL